MNVGTVFFFEKNLVNLLLLSSDTIINSKFRNNVNVKLSKSCTIFSKNSQHFVLILLIETEHLLRLPTILSTSYTNVSYNFLKIIQQRSQKFNENWYKINANLLKIFQRKNIVYVFFSISFLDRFYKISSIPNVLFLKNF